MSRRFRANMYELREGRKMRPKTFAAMLSNLLYERRFGPFFVEPIVAGIDPATKEPYICNMDLIGNKTDPEDFVVGGTSDDQLYGKNHKYAASCEMVCKILTLVGLFVGGYKSSPSDPLCRLNDLLNHQWVRPVWVRPTSVSDHYTPSIISYFQACARLCGPKTWTPSRSSRRPPKRSPTRSIATPVRGGAPSSTSSRRTRSRRGS